MIIAIEYDEIVRSGVWRDQSVEEVK